MLIKAENTKEVKTTSNDGKNRKSSKTRKRRKKPEPNIFEKNSDEQRNESIPRNSKNLENSS